ncbi:thioredoxin domain-containing protein [Actinokineospora sp. NBRC 105648]|uniref:DsbA family protein n=1 Tax=Actinokineospora sp. NBRC 105648 TaxID=3032206 RepID=UPI0024A30428|nr:thioredoxin domain-containing protein [Actinokineospora sp. NBRC 105648]GLZ41614.1 membrane protein [Actinokineospora sp. NBRC 105648]
MGGAERNARKRRQNQGAGTRPAAKNPVVAARKAGGDRNKVIIGVLVVLVIAAAVIGGVIYTNSKKDATAGSAIKVATVGFDVPVKRDGATVLVGKDSAKVTVDVYEDFLCPVCGDFEKTYGQEIEDKLTAGTVKVRYHIVNLLNTRSDPAGYSTDSANAALLAADEGKFLPFHKSLFGDQPEEGARGWTKDQLIDLGKAVGLSSQTFADGVRAGKYDAEVSAAYQQIKSTDYLQQDFGNGQKGFGTPTVAVDNKVVDTSNKGWLANLVGNSQG